MTYYEAVNVHGLYGKEIWNAAIDEAVKVADDLKFNQILGSDHCYKQDLADKIKDLKDKSRLKL